MKGKSKTKDKTKQVASSPLHYRSQQDRSYGLAGMALALATHDAFDTVVRISLDTPESMIVFSNDFYWGSSQASSPKAHWHALMQSFQLTTALALSNVMARCMVRERGADPTDMLTALYPTIEEEGMDVCSLEADEIRHIYENTLRQVHRTFANPRLHPYIDSLVQVIERRRTLSGREIAEELHALHII